jgi:alpha-beta hydrolase superfamily lysophospholipase
VTGAERTIIRETRLRTADGLTLYAWTCQPAAGQPKGAIALVHGMGEHSRRYDHLAGYWADHGYASAGFDLRGHGRSDGPRGHTPSYDRLMDDIASFLGLVSETYPDLPLTLYGHSMGGNLVLNYAIRRQPRLAHLVASAPYLRLAFEPPAWKLLMATCLKGIAPTMSLRTGLDVRALSRDAAVIRRYETDPLVHERITMSFFAHVHPAGEAIISRASELTTPTLLMHGGADKLTSLAGSEAFVAASSGKASLKIWDGRFHEIHNDPSWEELAAFVITWLAAGRVSGRPSSPSRLPGLEGC